jgi:hypothetical protein
MKAQVSPIDGTDGVFGITTESEWKVVPTLTLARRVAAIGLLAFAIRVRAKRKFSWMGSLHKYFYDVTSTGLSSCHVAVADADLVAVTNRNELVYYMQFDLPTTSQDDFTRTLETVGGERAKHPFYDLDKQQFSEDVTLSGATMRFAFRGAHH